MIKNHRFHLATKKGTPDPADQKNFGYWDETAHRLKLSGITPRVAYKSLLIEDVGNDWCHEHLGIPLRGFKIPYFDLAGVPTSFYRVRFIEELLPEWDEEKGRKVKRKVSKYRGPVGGGSHVYCPPILDWQKILADTSIRVVVTEGELKSICASINGIPTVGVGGVDSYQHDGKLLPELAQLAQGGRPITIAFDGEAKNSNVRRAEAAFAALLRAAGAKVSIFEIPHDGDKGTDKVGLDDFLMAQGADVVKAMLGAVPTLSAKAMVATMRKSMKANVARNRAIADAVLTELAASGRMIRTPNELLYLDDETKTLTVIEDTRDFRAFIDEKFDLCGADQEFKLAYELAADRAHTHGERTTVSKVTRCDATAGVWYRYHSRSQMIRVDLKGWRIIDNGTDGVLMRPRGQIADVEIGEGKASRSAFDVIVNIPNFAPGQAITVAQQRLLWALFIVGMNFPELHPTRMIALFVGEKGSGKTSGARAVLRTELGSQADVAIFDPKKLDAIEALLVNDPMAAVDNCDGRHEELQNMFAVAATGGTLKKRTLYTTMEQSEFKVDCFLMATSRDPRTFTRDDVTDRLGYFQVGRRATFKAESELRDLIDANRPKYFRWLLDTMPTIIRALKAAKSGVAVDDRMADFAKFALAVGPVIGYPVGEVRAALAAMATERLNFSANYSVVVQGLMAYVDDMPTSIAKLAKVEAKYNELIGRATAPRTAKELLAAIKSVKHDFPFKSPPTFGRALRDEAGAIAQKCRFEVSEDKKNGIKLYKIAPIGGFPAWKAVNAGGK